MKTTYTLIADNLNWRKYKKLLYQSGKISSTKRSENDSL
jgi:hypothetical protein